MSEETHSPVIGIDLGTTNSEVAVCVDGKIEVLEAEGACMVPSYVGLGPDGRLLVGTEARNQYILYPGKTVKSIKRKMGSDERVTLGETGYLPQEISAMILKKLKGLAEQYLEQPVSRAVITVPAQFNDAQRQATRDAGALAGLEVLRVINEPTAACLAYENDQQQRKAKNVLAFDLGGGTFDVSMVRIEDDVVEVIASHGNNHLGGDDFDALLAEHLKEGLATEEESALEPDQLSSYRINRAAETAKIHLSDHAHAKVIEDNLKAVDGTSCHIDREIARHEFEVLIRPLLAQTLQAVHQTLADADAKISDVDEIILVGGSTRLPLIHEMLEKEFKLVPRRDIHPDLAVVYGAGTMAARLMGEHDHRILVDITPYTFGISCMGILDGTYSLNLFRPVIKAGTPLPVNRDEPFFTIVEDQSQADIRIFQGEELDARRNILVGRFVIEHLSTAPAGSEITINMRLDLDGILRVTAVEKGTGKSKQVSIEDALVKLSNEKIEESRKKIEELFTGEETFAIDVNLGEDDENIIKLEPDDNSGGKVPETDNDELTRKFHDIQQRVNDVMDKMDEVDSKDVSELMEKLGSARNFANQKMFSEIYSEIEDILFYVEQ